MNVLAIDTSGPVCGVAVMTAEGIRFACAVQNKRTHSVNLMPMIDAGLRATGLTLQDMDRLACTVGPGSFTGVRLGVSTLKGLAHGCGKPCAGVNALEALAAGAGAFPGVVCPIQDARAGQVYGAAFRCTAEGAAPVRLMPDAPLKLEDYNISLVEFETAARQKALERGVLERADESARRLVGEFIASLPNTAGYSIDFKTSK